MKRTHVPIEKSPRTCHILYFLSIVHLLKQVLISANYIPIALGYSYLLLNVTVHVFYIKGARDKGPKNAYKLDIKYKQIIIIYNILVKDFVSVTKNGNVNSIISACIFYSISHVQNICKF